MVTLAYQAIDVLLQQPQIRALRKLRRFDWAKVEELYPDASTSEKHSAWRALKKLVAAGLVETRDASSGRHHEYRLTAAGRSELERVLMPDSRVSL